ncbi:MAG: LuxR C-terminal-related transcriptional regulator [Rickettsia endosymbiont of Glossina mortisans submortisans]|nr:LuxR C-terminal-related transcriptional regulator [Rickettsia endosymbiont of Glossina mortisans submortisans]
MYQKIDNQIHGIIFTMREIEIIACIININGRKKIADILNISPHTVEVYLLNLKSWQNG